MTPTMMEYFFVLLFIIPLALGLGFTSFDFESFRHEFDPEVYKYNNLQLVNYSNHKALNGCYVFNRNIEIFDLNVLATVPKKGQQPWTLLNVSLAGCKIFSNHNGKSKQILQMVIGRLMSTSPLIADTCPLSKDRLYCYNDFYLDGVHFPSYFPQTKLSILLKIKQQKIDIYTAHLDMAIQAKK